MMQSCASVAKLRSGGPILCYGVISHGVHRVTATSNRHWRPITIGQTGPCMDGARVARANLTFLRSVRVQPCIRPIFAWRITSVAMQPQWLLALM